MVFVSLGAGPLAGQPAEVVVSPPVVTVEETWLLDTDPLRDALHVGIEVLVSRNQPGGEPRDIPVRFEAFLTEAGGAHRMAGTASQTVVVAVPPVVDDMPVALFLPITPEFVLSEQIEHRLRIAVSHDDDPPSGDFQLDHVVDEGPYSIVHFSGALHFGSVDTTVNAFSVPPEELAGPGAWRIVVAEGELANGTLFSNGPPPSTAHLDVERDDSDGSASVVAGAVALEPDDRSFSVNGWTGTLGRIALDANGLLAISFSLNLPEGTGWRRADPDTDSPRTLNPVFFSEAASVPIDEDLQPIAPAAGTLFFAHEFVDERQAIGFAGAEWSWDLETLRIAQPETRFFRQWHYDQWKSEKGDLPDTNDGYFDQLLANALTDLHIRPGMAGGFSVELGLAAGEFFTHFPHGYVRHQGGLIRLENSVPDPTGSGMNGATTAIVTHTGCRPEEDPHALPDLATREAVAVGPGTLRFTAHGSLWTEGPPLTSLAGATVPIVRRAAAGLDPDGLPVHETAEYIGQNVQMLIPGATVPAASGTPGAFNPAGWLYTGVRTDEDDALESPGTAGYLSGAADYAGVNFRHFAGLTGISRIGGGVLGPYSLDPCQKVYARASGVTGRWAADENDLPPAIEIGGPDPFLFVFDVWAFQLVGNEPQFDYSAVTGSVSLPYPADFTLAFDSIEFRCCGNLDRLSLADGQSLQTLAYWDSSRIDIQSARFVSADECSMDDSALELHVRARANGFPNDLDGILLFRGSGRMTTGLDEPLPASALHVPTGSPFMGDYYITPVRHAYYNNPPPGVGPGGSGPGGGFINVAGHLNLPFFEAMEIHAVLWGMAEPPTGNPDIIPGLRRGWTDGDGKTFFTNADFDAEHRGLPPAFNTWLDYTTSQSETYLTVARRTWFGKIPFNFPVLFDPFTRHFHSVEKKEINVIIAQAEADVPRLNHHQAAIDFGITIGLSLNNLFADVLEFATGKLVGGFADLIIGSGLDALSDGLSELDGLLSLQARDALGDAIVPGFDDVISQAAQQINMGAGVPVALAQIDFGGALQEDLASATAGLVTGKLGPISNGLEQIRNFLEAGNETQIGQFMKEAMGFLDLPPGLGSLDVGELIELAELTDGPLRDRLDELRSRMEELRELVDNITGLGAQLEGVLTGANLDFSNLETGVQNALQGYFETVDADPAAYTQAEIEARIRSEIEDRFWALPVTHEMQSVLRSRFYHFDHLINQVVSGALEQINRALAEIIAEAIDLDELINDLTGIGGYVQTASLKGEAVITGNDLTYLSLKGRTAIQTEPVPLDFHPFFEYQQLHSDGAGSCNPNAIPVMFNRITMGAKVAPARTFGKDVSVTVSTQFSFTEGGGMIGFKGGFEILQEGLTMQPVNFDRINALLSVGAEHPDFTEFYFAAEGHATVFANDGPVQVPWSNFKLHGGIFVGRTCSDEPYVAWASDHVIDNMPPPPFTGAIASVEGTFPFVDVGCVLRVKAGAGIGAWGLVAGSDVDLGAFVAGTVSGRFACLISGDGSVLMLGQANKSGASLEGTVEANLKAGICPVCLQHEVKVGVKLGSPGGLKLDL